MMNITLLEEDKKYFSNFMVVDCNLAEYYVSIVENRMSNCVGK